MQKYPNLPVRKSAGGNLPTEIPKSASQEICWGESTNRNTQICQSVKLHEGNLLVSKSASQEICQGEICWQKYPNLPVSKAAWGEPASRNTQICQLGNLLGEICWQKYSNLPVSKSVSRFTKSASQEICWGESVGRNTQICQSRNLPGGICWQKYPNLPVRKSAGGNLLAEIPKSASK